MVHAKFLSVSDRAYLVSVLRCPSEDHGIARRANAILLLDDGLSHAKVAEVLYLSEGTIREWHKRFRDGGFDELSTFDWQGGAILSDPGPRAATDRPHQGQGLPLDGADQGLYQAAFRH